MLREKRFLCNCENYWPDHLPQADRGQNCLLWVIVLPVTEFCQFLDQLQFTDL